MTHVKRFAWLSTLLLLMALPVFAADEVVTRAKQQLDNGDAQGAYNLLIPLQSDRAGDPEFDFVLGSAALQLGKNTEAIFALERVLAVLPNNAPARALIARAYFNLKELETSKREIDNVKRQDIPPEVSLVMDRMLDRINRDLDAQKTTFHGWVEIGAGWDSNVNSATAVDQVAAPGFGGLIFTLAPASREQEDAFVTFGGGVNVTHPLSKRTSIYGGIAYQNKSNVHESDFSTYYYDVNFGIQHRRDRDLVSLTAIFNTFYVDNSQLYNDAYRNATGLTGQWQHDFDSRNQISFFGQYSFLEYPDQKIRNADRYVAGAGYAHSFGRGTVITYLGVYGGVEDEKEDGVPQFGHELYGARIGLQWNVVEKYALFFNGSAERREYGDPPPGDPFGYGRNDTQYSASGGMIFVPAKGVRVTPQASWTDNDSNIPINEFDRIIYQVLLRYDF